MKLVFNNSSFLIHAKRFYNCDPFLLILSATISHTEPLIWRPNQRADLPCKFFPQINIRYLKQLVRMLLHFLLQTKSLGTQIFFNTIFSQSYNPDIFICCIWSLNTLKLLTISASDKCSSRSHFMYHLWHDKIFIPSIAFWIWQHFPLSFQFLILLNFS